VQAKIIKLVGLKNGERLSPINLVTFGGTQNGEYSRHLTNLIAVTQSVKQLKHAKINHFKHRE
jgi:hypothetical protein